MLSRFLPEKEFILLATKLGWSKKFCSLVLHNKCLIRIFETSFVESSSCYTCSQPLSSNKWMIEVNDKYMHLECLTTISCLSCKSDVQITESYFEIMNDNVICNTCIAGRVACKNCKGFYLEKDLLRGHCVDCIISCAACKEKIPILESMKSPSRHSKVCKTCGRREVFVKPYNFNPMELLSFEGSPKDGIYFGVELELETSSKSTAVDIAEDVTKSFGKCVVVKHDGSLDENGLKGIEIVTAPGSLEWHRKFWKSFFDKNYDFISNKSDRCSTHIHISRSHLKPMQLARLTYWIYAKNNRKLIELIGGRSLTTDWANKYSSLEFGSPLSLKNLIELEGSKAFYKKHFGLEEAEEFEIPHSQRRMRFLNPRLPKGKYQALNISKNETIEMRIFAGTSQYDTMVKNLEFCKSLIEYCNLYQSSYTGLATSLEYLEFLKSNKKDYNYLYRFLESRNVFNLKSVEAQLPLFNKKSSTTSEEVDLEEQAVEVEEMAVSVATWTNLVANTSPLYAMNIAPPSPSPSEILPPLAPEGFL